MSPAGTHIVYLANGRLYLRSLSDLEVRPITGAAAAGLGSLPSGSMSLKLGTPASYADAFRRLEQARIIDTPLADRLVRAAGFRNIAAHADETIDMRRVHAAAKEGPADLLAFIASLRDRVLPPKL